jgi:hypothetical protein
MQSANIICHPTRGHLSVQFRPPPPSLRILLAATSSLCPGLTVLYLVLVLPHTEAGAMQRQSFQHGRWAPGAGAERPGEKLLARNGCASALEAVACPVHSA